MKKLISWLLLCALLLSLAACGSSGQVVSPTSDSGDWGGRGQPFALKSVELPGQALGLAACGDALCVLVQGEARALYSVEGGQLVQLGYSEADGAAGRMTADESGVWLTLIGAEGAPNYAWHTIRWTAAAQTLTLSRTCRTAPAWPMAVD